MATRHVLEVREAKATREGAGVRLHRAFGEVHPRLDPFLLLDDFGSGNPRDYQAGFPWHPHRGMETITYLLEGRVAHRDSLGHHGEIGPGDIQWMTAGRGIIHEEMPLPSPRLRGLQLWANLPAAKKLAPPRYQNIPASVVPLEEAATGVEIRVLAGRVGDVSGPVTGIASEPEYLDVTLTSGASYVHPMPAARNAFAYVIEGAAQLGDERITLNGRQVAIFGDGDALRIEAGEAGCRLILVSAVPLREPVAWGGPIVMNTDEELQRAFAELDAGTFLKGD